MTQRQSPQDRSSLETRPSLLGRLQTADDADSWKEFYRLYGGLIRKFSLRAGLTMDEAEDVVQETAIGVARGLPHFVYDPETCRFKTWLLNLTRWRIQNQFRRRMRVGQGHQPDPAASPRGDESTGTAIMHRVPDPHVPDFGAEWDLAYEKNLLAQAMQTVRERLDSRQFQAFDLYVNKSWPALDVAKTLGLSVAHVYLNRHRVTVQLRKEVERLQRKLEQRINSSSR
jgi:RNA polymerase sigma-70 factor (ECF subfamily)